MTASTEHPDVLDEAREAVLAFAANMFGTRLTGAELERAMAVYLLGKSAGIARARAILDEVTA